jgi:hypothetical protein
MFATGKSSLAAVLLVVCAGAATGQTIYSDFGSNNSFSGSGWCVSGPNNSDCTSNHTRWIAAPFFVGATAKLGSIAIALGNISGTNGATISLMGNAGGIPAENTLESWTISNLPSTSSPAITTLTSKNNPTLLVETAYWIVVQPAAANTMDYWFTNNLGLNGGLQDVDFAGWTSLTSTNPTLPAFAVYAVPPGPPALGVSPTSISNTGFVGNTVELTSSPQAPIQISSSNSTQISFTATTQTGNQVGPNWLTVSTGGAAATSLSGTTPANLRIFANLQGLAPSPPGTHYTATITITPTSTSSSGPMTITATVTAKGTDGLQLQWAPTSPTNQQTMALSTPYGLSGTIQVLSQGLSSSPKIPGMYFGTITNVATPPGGNWLQMQPPGNQASQNTYILVNAVTAGLASGSYQGSIAFTDTNNMVETTLFVTLNVTGPAATLVATPSAVTITSPANGPPITQTVNLTSSDGTTALTLQGVSDDGVPWALVQGSGTNSANGPVTPGALSITVTPSGLTAGPHIDNVVVTSNASNSPVRIPVTLTIQASGVQTIPRVVDAPGAQTSINLVNRDTATASYTMQFFDPSGAPLNINLAAGSSPLTGSIPVGGMVTILTAGQGPAVVGWGLLTTQNQIAGFGVYRQTETGIPTQEATMPLNSGGLRHFLLPFDNSNGFATSMAITNINGSLTANISATVHDSTGSVLSQGSLLAVAAHGHTAFETASQFAQCKNIRGVLEFTSDQDVSVVAFRFNPAGTFTSFDVLALASPPAVPTEASIPRVANGSGFAQSQIILVNTDTVQASYALRFYDAGGNALSIPLATGSAPLSGSIPVGGSATITTSGTGTTVAGWGQLSTQNSIAGFGVYSQSETGIPTQEATMPLNAAGTRHFLVPYDNTIGFDSSMAITNLNASQQVHITATVRDSFGNVLSHPTMNPLAPYGHNAFRILDQIPNVANIRGVLEFTTDQDVSVVAFRFATSGTFTSVRVVPLN